MSKAQLVITAVVLEGRSKSEVARDYDLSRQWVHQLVTRYHADGAGLAGPNEVLVSSTLRDLVIGSGLEIEDRGTHQLKRVPGEWRVFAVASA
jgi:hypothetical protein